MMMHTKRKEKKNNNRQEISIKLIQKHKERGKKHTGTKEKIKTQKK
jgi:hypothetical protein